MRGIAKKSCRTNSRKFRKRNRNCFPASSVWAGRSPPWSAPSLKGDERADILMLLAAIRGGVNSLMAEILEDHVRLHITHPDRGTDSREELTEDLISLVRAYLK